MSMPEVGSKDTIAATCYDALSSEGFGRTDLRQKNMGYGLETKKATLSIG